MKPKYTSITKTFYDYRDVFEALGNPVRQEIMFMLAKTAAENKQLSVRELATRTTLSRPTISHHIKILYRARLVVPSKTGTQIFYRPRFETPLAMAKELSCVLGKIVDSKKTAQLDENCTPAYEH